MQYIDIVRPSKLSQFIGKKHVINSLSMGIQVAKKNKTPMDHTLFYGPAGVGKTSLAHIIANEIGSKIKIIQSSNIRKLPDLIGILTSLKPLDVLFIDEIHTLKTEFMELLYPAMEDHSLDIMVGKNYNSKLIRLKLPPFTLIAATTNFGTLTKSLEERFGYVFFIDSYDQKELRAIINNIADKLKIKISPKDIEKIQENSRGTPRNCNRIMKRIKDYLSLYAEIDVGEVIRECGYIYKGLTSIDFKYLNFLYGEKDWTAGVSSLVQSINLDEKTIINKIEPFLLEMKYISRRSRGRKLTELGQEVIGKLIQAMKANA